MSRSHGEGSIFQRKDGRWQASLQVAGVRKTVYGKTRREAAAKLAELKRRVGGGSLPDPGRRTVADLIGAWLEVAAPTLRPKTLHEYTRLCELHILPALGEVKLSRLDPARVERLLAAVAARRQAQHAWACLHRACVFAVRWGWLAQNPMTRVQKPAHRAKRAAVWTSAELRAFLAGAPGHWLYPVWYTLVATGCRVGEVLALTWQDVDFENGAIRVNKTLQRVRGEYVMSKPKTTAGERTVNLPAEAMAVLRQQRGRQVLAGLAGQLVFTNLAGAPLHVSTVTHALTRECERLGVTRVTPHGLRHLHASLLLDAGLPVPVVSARLGHATPAVTMAVYAHAVRRRDDASADAIGRALAGE